MSNEVPSPVSELARQVLALLRARADELDLTEARIGAIRPRGAVAPASLPVVADIARFDALASEVTRPVVRAVMQAADHLYWRQTYSWSDGFSDDFLQHYGWFELAGPDGPYASDGLRVAIGCWGQGLTYPDHSHPPEEHYLVLAGGARFRLEAGPWLDLGPGEIFHTPPGAVHSADMRARPLMAMALWRADDLTVRINLTDQNRDVVLDRD